MLLVDSDMNQQPGMDYRLNFYRSMDNRLSKTNITNCCSCLGKALINVAYARERRPMDHGYFSSRCTDSVRDLFGATDSLQLMGLVGSKMGISLLVFKRLSMA